MSGFKSAGVDFDQLFMSPNDLDPYIRGMLWVRGDNGAGQLMTGNTSRVNSFAINGAGEGWVKVAVCSESALNTSNLVHSVGLKRGSPASSSDIYVCGNNNNGQLGLGDYTSRSTPVFVGSGFVDISVGPRTSYIVRADGYLFVAGLNSSYELGTGDTTTRNSFYALMNGVRQVSAGPGYACVITSDGKLFSWGSNTYGALGLGSTTVATTPTQVGTSTDWKQVACGEFGHTVGLKTDGTLWVWGLSSWFAGATSVPTQVGTSTWSFVCAGMNTIGAVRSDGTLWAWGNNGSGQLGDGTTTNRNTPVQIGSSNNWKSVDMSYVSTIATKVDGSVWGWGNDLQGTLGGNSYTPVQIAQATNYSAVSAVTSRYSTFIIATR